jgi:hypothetical protein
MLKRGFRVFGIIALLMVAVGAGNLFLSREMKITPRDPGGGGQVRSPGHDADVGHVR